MGFFPFPFMWGEERYLIVANFWLIQVMVLSDVKVGENEVLFRVTRMDAEARIKNKQKHCFRYLFFDCKTTLSFKFS